VTDLLDYTNQF